MNIAILLPSLHMGGGEKFAVDLANELAKDPNNQVTLCILTKIDKNMTLFQSVSSIVTLVSLNKNAGFEYKILFKLRNFLKDGQFNIVHTHLRTMYYSSWSILTIRNIQFIHTFHTLITKEVSSSIYKILLKFFFTHLKVTPVAITPKVLEGIQDFFGKEHKHLILNGVSKLRTSKNFEDVSNEISSYKKDQFTKVFINVARVTKVKNQKLLIESFKNISENAILVIVGSLSNEPTYAKECQALAIDSNNIFFLDEKNNVGDYIQCSDALCLSSIFEGLPLVILEAMSLGKPTLSTNVGGIPDVIKNDINGYLSSDMSSNSYSNTIRNFINNAKLKQETIYSIFEKNYSMTICANNYYNLYKNTLKKENS